MSLKSLVAAAPTVLKRVADARSCLLVEVSKQLLQKALRWMRTRSIKEPRERGILGALGFKRKQSDRSPEEALSSNLAAHYNMVCVLVPPSSRPLHLYTQMASPSPVSRIESMGPPPLSNSPSLSSFDSFHVGSSSGQTFEINRLQMMVNASQEDLHSVQTQFDEEREQLRRRYAARERQQEERFNAERLMYQARIRELEAALFSGGNRGEGSRHG